MMYTLFLFFTARPLRFEKEKCLLPSSAAVTSPLKRRVCEETESKTVHTSKLFLLLLSTRVLVVSNQMLMYITNALPVKWSIFQTKIHAHFNNILFSVLVYWFFFFFVSVQIMSSVGDVQLSIVIFSFWVSVFFLSLGLLVLCICPRHPSIIWKIL